MQYRQNSKDHQGLSYLSHRGVHNAGVVGDGMGSVTIQVVVQSGFMILGWASGTVVT
jgi:hypothetical protein